MRVFLFVLDSFGCGNAPDSKAFGDFGANTLKSVSSSPDFRAPNLEKLGLFNIDGVDFGNKAAEPFGAYGRMVEKSLGKDTTIGHFELAGILSEKPLPTYPNGFPEEIIREFERQTGRKTLCNKPYSGTEVIRDYGEEHLKTGALIVYTSADSVFQIAAHEEVVPLAELYRYCETARKIMTGEHGVGRIIARPFIGEPGEFVRTSNRHDFSLKPPKTTMLDVLKERGYATIGVGKIYDIFAGVGISEKITTSGNEDGINKATALFDGDFSGLAFINLVDTDMLYGHRRDVSGYAKAVSRFDEAIPVMLSKMKPEDLLIITADHGCDPGFKGTDHTRETVPLIAAGGRVKAGNLGTIEGFSSLAASILKYFGLDFSQIDGEPIKELYV